MDLELNQMPAMEKASAHIVEIVAAWVVQQDVVDQCTPAEELEDISEVAEQEEHPGFGSD